MPTQQKAALSSNQIKLFSLLAGTSLVSALTLVYGPTFVYTGSLVAGLGSYLMFPDVVEKNIDIHKNAILGGAIGFVFAGPFGFAAGAWATHAIEKKWMQAMEQVHRATENVNHATQMATAPVRAVTGLPNRLRQSVQNLFATQRNGEDDADNDTASTASTDSIAPGRIEELGEMFFGRPTYSSDSSNVSSNSASSSSSSSQDSRPGFFTQFCIAGMFQGASTPSSSRTSSLVSDPQEPAASIPGAIAQNDDVSGSIAPINPTSPMARAGSVHESASESESFYTADDRSIRSM